MSELIPPSSIDIHSHLLPGIDDGAKTIEDTTFLISELKEIGFSVFITTPHVLNGIWDNTSAIIQENYNNHEQVINHNAKNTIRVAAEYMMDNSFLQLINSEPLLCLKDNYVLVEMSYSSPPLQLYDIIFELQLAGYKPVLAHPERYNFFHNDFESYNKLKKYGCSFQLNILSTVGYYGENVTLIAEKLLNREYIDYVGTDVHHERHIRAFQEKVIIKSTSQFTEALLRNKIFI
ncbi:tyrosine-protein phosphatase [Flavobacterium sp.]